VQPLSTTLIIDSEVVTPQVNTTSGFAYTPTVRLTEGVHTVTAQVYDQAGNQTQSGPWSFTVVDDSAVSLGVTKYYMLGSQRVAMRQDDVVYFIHSDHLGSTSLTTDITGTLVAETRYLPYGEERWITGTLVTDFTFTGQRAERGFALMDYNARYYDPRLGRFISPDSIVHNPSNPNDLNRYSYGRNNPLKYIDPTGHQIIAAGLGEVVLLAGLALLAYEAYEVGCQYGWGPNAAENRQALATAVNDVAEQVGTAFTPPSVPSSNPDAFPLGSPPDPYSPPGVELDVPEWSGLPGVPLDQPDTRTRAIDFPLEQPHDRDSVILAAKGRVGKQQRLRELVDDPKVSSADRGWIKQELDHIERGQRHSIRVPPGKNLAHRRGFEAKEGFGYEHSDLQDIDLHKLQHRYEGY
jgi:RHS repeat-associated protein